MPTPTIAGDQSGEWHRERFADFARIKAKLGEPSPHMTMVGFMSAQQDLDEVFWRGGCYLVPYSVLTAEAIWREWPVDRAVQYPEELAQWITDNWAGIHTRIERRCVRTPAQFARSLNGVAHWIANDVQKVLDTEPQDDRAAYEHWWKTAMDLPYFGRYVAIRLLEYLRRYAGVNAKIYDIRSIGGWSPIKCLMYLYPEDIEELSTGKQELVEKVAEKGLEDFAVNHNLPMTHYVFAALLCEYRVAWEKRHQYPGWTIDQEIEYDHGKNAQYWRDRGCQSDLYFVREKLFPHQCLGEKNGWEGRRYDVAALIRDYGIVWDDTKWDYMSSRVLLSEPVKWSDK